MCQKNVSLSFPLQSLISFPQMQTGVVWQSTNSWVSQILRGSSRHHFLAMFLGRSLQLSGADVFHLENGFKKVKVKSPSRIRLFATLWTVAHKSPPSMGFSRQEYWSGLPLPSPGGLPHPRIRPTSQKSPALQAGALTSEPPRHKSQQDPL